MSESTRDLLRDAEWWLCEGGAKLVVVIKVLGGWGRVGGSVGPRCEGRLTSRSGGEAKPHRMQGCRVGAAGVDKIYM